MYEVVDETVAPSPPSTLVTTRPGAPVDPGRLLQEVRSRRGWIALAFGAGLLVAVPLARAGAPLAYLGKASVLRERPAITIDAAEDRRAQRTLVDSVEMPASLARVRRRLKLRESVPEIAAAIDVAYDLDSNLLTVSARSGDPARAARLANATVEELVRERRSIEEERRRAATALLDRDLSRARDELARSERELGEFRSSRGVADLDAEIGRAGSTLAHLRAQADRARADAAAEDARARAVAAEARRQHRTTVVETVAEAPPEAPETDSLARARVELAEAQARATPVHPDVVAAEARVAAIESELAAAPEDPPEAAPSRSRTIVSGGLPSGIVAQAAVARDVARRRHQSLVALAAAAERRLAGLIASRDRSDDLTGARDLALAHVAELEALRARAADRARSSATGLRVVDWASPPKRAESYFATIATGVSVPIVASLLALFAVVASAVQGLRVWTAREAAYWGLAPVVGSTGWPAESGAASDVWDEISDGAAAAEGVTLVVGATRADAALAREVADALSSVEDEAREDPRPIRIEASVDTVATTGPGVYSWVDPGTRRSKPSLPGGRSIVPEPPPPARRLVHEAWRGAPSGPATRRAARLADRVLVVLRSGSLSTLEVAKLRHRLGRSDGIAFLLVGVQAKLAALPSRAGDVDGYWLFTRG